MVQVKVRISHLAIKLPSGERKVFSTGEVFDCPEEKLSDLRNAVIVVQENEPEPTNPEGQTGRKRR